MSLSAFQLQYSYHLVRLFVTVITVIVHTCTRPSAKPLTMITMRKSNHGFPFLSIMDVLLHKLWATRAPLKSISQGATNHHKVQQSVALYMFVTCITEVCLLLLYLFTFTRKLNSIYCFIPLLTISCAKNVQYNFLIYSEIFTACTPTYIFFFFVLLH